VVAFWIADAGRERLTTSIVRAALRPARSIGGPELSLRALTYALAVIVAAGPRVAHLSGMGARAPVISVAAGPYETVGISAVARLGMTLKKKKSSPRSNASAKTSRRSRRSSSTRSRG
jgi:hypothetical protein